jgi:serine/threonine-protein kinase HipA
MTRSANIFMFDDLAGLLEETDGGKYIFTYHESYLKRKDAPPVSLTLPLRSEPYESMVLFPFFDGLIPEGWLLGLSIKNWKLNPNDRMGLLLKTCENCIGAAKVIENE